MEDRLQHIPAKNEEALFSLQFSIVLVEHLRVISQVLRKRHTLAPNAYSTLVVLDVLKRPIDATTLTNYLVFKQGTLLAILAALEDRGFVHKDIDPIDERCMLVSLTSAGQVIARQLASEVAQLMAETFWRSRPTSDYLVPLLELEDHLEKVRGFSVQIDPLEKRSTGLTHALLFRIIRLIIDAWTQTTKQQDGLSFNEGRVLLLLEHFGELTPSEIAQRLRLARSGVSLNLARLSDLLLVNSFQNLSDGRVKVFRCTYKGLRHSRELFAALRKTTSDVYGNYSDDAVITLNEQHMGMYRDLGFVQERLDIILSE